MLEIKIDKEAVEKLYLDEVCQHLKKLETETLFWDTKELIKQTRLSWGTIQREFFFDTRFVKYKLGRKWLFPAKETKEFLLTWIEEKRY